LGGLLAAWFEVGFRRVVAPFDSGEEAINVQLAIAKALVNGIACVVGAAFLF
jgi:hypothetical protein